MAKNRLTWSQVANNFLLRLTSTGQLPFLAVILLLAFLIYRTPPENISQVWVVFGELLDRRSALGYTLFVATGGSWAAHAKHQRRVFEKELERVTEERNKAQQMHFNKKLRSTK